MEVISYIISRACNVSCKYCCLSKKGLYMSPEVFVKASGILFSKIKKTSLVKFFGGEPLLNFELVKFGYNFLKQKGFTGTFELGTNGTLLDENITNWLSARPDIQVNLNASFGWNNNAAKLKNVMWNFCITPHEPDKTLKVLNSFYSKISKYGHRANLLPAFYCEWTPEQLRKLNFILTKIIDFLDFQKIPLENCKRYANIPLFNEGLTIDIDGTVYSSNMCLANLPVSLLERLKYKRGRRLYQVTNKDLISAFGIKKVASTFAASEILNKYVK